MSKLTLKQSFYIVLDLASENALNLRDTEGSAVLIEEHRRQQEALTNIYKHLKTI